MRDKREIQNDITSGNTVIGIELGSTRIKTVLLDSQNTPIASGNYDWENHYIDGIWTYDLDDVTIGLQGSFGKMAETVKVQFGISLNKTASIGISGMMHGYLAFDKSGNLLVPFRTWRNNITGQASIELTDLFQYPIPQRWSIAHLYQAIKNKEPHVADVAYITTLAGYVHWKLTGRKVLGISEASGVFPIDLETKDFNKKMIGQFNENIQTENIPWKLETLLPSVLVAGQAAGELTEEGAKMLDSTNQLSPGIPLCPPESDGGTGMVATNSIAPRTGNVSAGTSVFAMIVLEKELSRVYPEIDLITTPSGDLVAMVHSNNCTSDYDAWMTLFGEVAEALGAKVSKGELYDTLLRQALEGDPDGGGLLAYGYVSGEHITHFSEGRPLFTRTSSSHFNLANFMRVNLFTALGALKIGMDLLNQQEKVQIDQITGHGGFFKTKDVGQRIMAAAMNVPVSVLETAGEGGAYGIALLASYMVRKQEKETLQEYLGKIFDAEKVTTIQTDPADVDGFLGFMERYKKGLPIESAAIDYFK
jgi:sugar (pentulose or hexulose) kinase